MPHEKGHSLDALLPAEMAIKAEQVGVKKATMNFGALLALSVLAGAFIAFGAAFSTTAIAGASGSMPFGLIRLIAGLVFSLGLILVVVGGAELFTGNNLIVMAWANRKVSLVQLLRNWAIVYLGNFIGAFATAALIYLSAQHTLGGGVVGAAALATAEAKSGLSFSQAFVRGILCNVLVCLAVWLSYSGRTAADKMLAVIPPITAFVACGFEHSIANMYFIPVGLFIKSWASDSFWNQIGKAANDYPALNWDHFLTANLVPVTLGNIIGGAVLVGIVYWFVYLRKTN
jgi:formate transporter FocA